MFCWSSLSITALEHPQWSKGRPKRRGSMGHMATISTIASPSGRAAMEVEVAELRTMKWGHVLRYRQRREGNGFDPRFGHVLFFILFFGTLGMKLLVIWCGVVWCGFYFWLVFMDEEMVGEINLLSPWICRFAGSRWFGVLMGWFVEGEVLGWWVEIHAASSNGRTIIRRQRRPRCYNRKPILIGFWFVGFDPCQGLIVFTDAQTSQINFLIYLFRKIFLLVFLDFFNLKILNITWRK